MSNPYASPVDLFDRYDVRSTLELSGDSNVPDGQLDRITRLLDAEAAKLDTYLNGRWAIPLAINVTSLLNAASANATSVVLAGTAPPAGYTYQQRLAIFMDSLGNPAEIVTVTGISGTTLTVTGSGQNQANFNSNPSGLSFAHAAGAGLGLLFLPATDYICTYVADRLFGRRPQRPDALDKAIDYQAKWLSDLVDGRITIPGLGRQIVPQLQSSDFTDGRSQFDDLFGYLPSPTGPSRGK